MKTKITTESEEVTYFRKTKRYQLLVNDKEVEVEKWWLEDEIGNSYECDFEITEGKEALTEDEDEDLNDYINELK